MTKPKSTEDQAFFADKLKESKDAPKTEGPQAPQEETFSEYIAVAEDSAPNMIIISGILKKLGFGVLQFKNGKEAKEHFEKMSDEDSKKLKAVFSDFMMPSLDGLELLKAVRSVEKTKSLPFIMITSVSERQAIRTAGNLGVNGYVLKPVTTDVIIKSLSSIFPGRFQAPPAKTAR